FFKNYINSDFENRKNKIEDMIYLKYPNYELENIKYVKIKGKYLLYEARSKSLNSKIQLKVNSVYNDFIEIIE
ncbi:MAG: hypothetical protein RQ735_12335, partial [Flavobacteriaceae bacterium]|nr:hypothetical protein [Flavobacteriaceae bacterium]